MNALPTTCKNAYVGPAAWYCYHYLGIPTAGKEAVDTNGECEACARVSATVETLPNFMTDEGQN